MYMIIYIYIYIHCCKLNLLFFSFDPCRSAGGVWLLRALMTWPTAIRTYLMMRAGGRRNGHQIPGWSHLHIPCCLVSA